MIANRKKFDRNKSVLKDVYYFFSVNDPGELRDLYDREDQKLMIAAEWDYKNPDLIPNKIKSKIEEINILNIPDEKEKKWIQNILWLWYHHAISCALWRHGDKEAALKYSETALLLQPRDHPNKITKLLYLLVREDLTEAKKWAAFITEEPEKTMAERIIREYEDGTFFTLQVGKI